ncbi:MAG: glycosyltransferase [Methanomicrobiales archaeon]|nr:glycosyltransferase [Methanomicrobiales archaeon]MDI6877547.1 glycosyltransferase [Methanomicrobiales archaeon]
MKAMVVTPYFYPHMGGVQRYVYEIGTRLKRDYDMDVTVVCSNWDRATNYRHEAQLDGLRVIYIPYLFKVSSTPVHPLWGRTLQTIVESEKPDIINGHAPVPFIADIAARVAQAQGIPYVLTYHNDLTGYNPLIRLYSRLYYRGLGDATLDAADRIIVTSNYYAASSPYLEGHARKIGIVPPGVDPERYRPVPKALLKQRYGLDIQKILLFVGQLNRESQHKGLDYLIRALKLVRRDEDARLIVVGTGNYRDHYEKLAAREGLEGDVIFAGFVTNEEIPQYFSGSDLMVLPSYDRAEGFGMVLIEAQACGIPVIGTNVGGIPFAVEDGKTGLIVPPRDAESLAKAILRLFCDTELYRSMAENGPVRVREHFTWEKSSAAYHGILTDLLCEKEVTESPGIGRP